MKFSTDKLFLCTALMLCNSCIMLAQQKESDFMEAALAYANAIRWKHYDVARRLRKGPSEIGDYDSIRDIKVTSYRTVQKTVSNEGNRIEQTVEIRYLREPSISERILFDKQVWIYDDTGWGLQGDLPRFEKRKQRFR